MSEQAASRVAACSSSDREDPPQADEGGPASSTPSPSGQRQAQAEPAPGRGALAHAVACAATDGIERAKLPDAASSNSPKARESQATVEALVQGFLENDMHVKFMLDALEQAGCPFPLNKIEVAECQGNTLGGFIPCEGIVLCHNAYQGAPTEMRNTIVHELVHAYDHCRAKSLDWAVCKHLACSEVRAANLSGDCSFEMEWLRGKWAFFPGYQKSCVRRRAELSVAMMPQCALTARTAVASVIDECYKDTAPFDRAP